MVRAGTLEQSTSTYMFQDPAFSLKSLLMVRAGTLEKNTSTYMFQGPLTSRFVSWGGDRKLREMPQQWMAMTKNA